MEKELEITTTGSPPDPAGDHIPALHQDQKNAEKPDILDDDITNIDVSEDKDSRASTEDEEQHISFRPVEPVAVSVRGLTITVSEHSTLGKKKKKPNNSDGGEAPPEEKEKKILDAVSADFPAGELTAIIGGSGSGKTSMLNIMSSRMTGTNLRTTGTTTFAGGRALSDVSYAYVMQQDVLLPTLTVRETLQYSAELRLPASTTPAERTRVVEEVILQLGLKECADTRIGDNEHKGCSGGEKRRTSIGVQLLANPSVLFLDEPTTGLDATSAFQVVRTLKRLAARGRTVVATIHQPRSEIWGLFDRIVLLSGGRPLYAGRVEGVLEHFRGLGWPLREHENPADFLVDLAAVDYRGARAEDESRARITGLVERWREAEGKVLAEENGGGGGVGKGVCDAPQQGGGKKLQSGPGLGREIAVLTRRGLKITFRDPMGIAGALFEAILMGVIAGWIFFDVNKSLSGIRTREAALYIAASLQGYLILLFETYRICETDIKLFDRERGEGVVSVVGFLVSRRIARLCEDITVPFLFSTIFYFMVGFDSAPVQYFVFFAIVLVGQFLAVSFATLCVGVNRNFAEAVLVGNLSYTLQSVACGYFIQASTMPVYVRWCKYISYNWYAFGALVSNEFSDKFYACPATNASPTNPQCLEYTGKFILDSLSFPEHWRTVPIVINVSWAVFFYIVAGLLLKFKPVDINVSSARPKSDEKDRSAGKENITRTGREQVKEIDVVLDNCSLTIEKPGMSLGLFGKTKGTVELEILKGVSSRFEAGKLNVIMGPSGSGKSTLLNLMSRRLHSSISTRYRSAGKMLFNGALPSDTVIRSLCSYVTQDDDALLPSLTVRETLQFAAALRLPGWMSKEEKHRRAEEVILKMGLKDCADNLIGSEFAKGISGGEKRRVTIAVQILTEPRILLLDEPTSGLDAFTAASILGVLRGLAEEGRTVISTIHQSRSDLFQGFGNILLLARGGHVVYSGKGDQMLPYFASLGHTCPTTTNPADFALDLVTVDLQHAGREAASRVKVQRLIERFSHSEALALEEGAAPKEISLPAELGQMKRAKAPFRTAYPILVRRGLINLRRQPQQIVARLMQVVGLGIILALFYSPLKHDYYSVQNRVGFVQQILSLIFVGMLQNVSVYPFERDVFYKEHDDRAYGTTAFFIAYLTLELPFELATSLIFSVLAVLAVGLPRTAKLFFIVTFNTFCITSCGESVGIFFNTLFAHTGFSVNVTSTILSIGVFMAGIMSIDMPGFLEAFNYLSPNKYATQNLVPYSMMGVKFTCTDAQRLPGGRCPLETGEEALALFGMGTKDVWWSLVGLAIATVAYRAIAYMVLRVRRMHLGVRMKE
ncbi:uncharacterized protein LAJ45_09947 [Morchella importuna]|uniref:uncharacterized protein n=1 Tax=Morchella importuna TaxID=1174673 RepID=UPI001E8DA384|nr:uncharacterized protein LAJ45_09947 [Morchella importuna]KAH8146025.1 hypothetical protein LAJ45_09947 [Morchella importuna]